MSDERLPRTVREEDSVPLGGSTKPLSVREHAELTALADLVATEAQFELSPEARSRGLLQLETLLDARAKRKGPIVTLWWSVPVAAAVLLAWLLPMNPAREAAPPVAPALLEAQNAHLTARLTGLPMPRDELDQAQKVYRDELLAKLEKSR